MKSLARHASTARLASSPTYTVFSRSSFQYGIIARRSPISGSFTARARALTSYLFDVARGIVDD